MEESKSNVQTGYDRVAEHYANEFFEELARKPYEFEHPTKRIYMFASNTK